MQKKKTKATGLKPAGIRAALGWTQTTMAEALNISRSHYAMVEGGIRPLSKWMVEELRGLAEVAEQQSVVPPSKKGTEVEKWVIEGAQQHLQRLIVKEQQMQVQLEQRLLIHVNNADKLEHAQRVSAAIKSAGLSSFAYNASKIHGHEVAKQILGHDPLKALLETAKLKALKAEISEVRSFLSNHAPEKRK